MFNERGKGKFIKMFLVPLVTCVGVGLIVFFLATGRTPRTPVPTQPQQSTQLQNNTAPKIQQMAVEQTGGSPVATSVAKSSTPGVVGISVLKVSTSSIFDRNATEKWGVGSGVIVTSNGYILTNNHVAGGKNKRIIVSLADGRNVDGVTVWSDSVMDLAVVKVNLNDLPTIPLGDSASLQVGEPAIAIGNPLGLQFQRTVTSGIISALNRTIKIDTDQGPNYMEDLIQTDASINPGNSGGPLLNSKGQVIGINTVKVTSAEGIGFAIPINVAVPLVKQLASGGEFVEPYLGVFAYDKEVIPYLDSNISLDKGIYVANIDQSGPAFKSGIRVGCIITQVDGQDVNTMIQLRTYLYSKKPGDTLNITHIKNGNTVVTSVKLAAKEKDGLITR